MARTNLKPVNTLTTHEGAPAVPVNAEAQLRRAVMSCLLWEKEFYQDGEDIAQRILTLVPQVSRHTVRQIAIEAREQAKLRHVPLLIAAALCKYSHPDGIAAETVAAVIQRADELAEFVSIVCKINGVGPDKAKKVLSAQAKTGLAAAFRKFDAYHLAKYNRDGAVKLRDVLFMVHPKPVKEGQAEVWAKLAANALESPDTWEVALSAGADKRETFERLIREGKLGYLALLRNLRNMVESGCDLGLVQDAILARKGADRVLPFRYVAAARVVPHLEPAIDQALLAALNDFPALPGVTAVLVDVSGSMDEKLSAKSDLKRLDAAAALASIIQGQRRVFSFSERVMEIPPRLGMAGIDAISRSQPHSGTYLGRAVAALNAEVKHDRLIVITDEQSHDPVGVPLAKHAYMINVASNKNGVGYRNGWNHIDGFSENVLRWIAAHEAV